MTKVVVTGGAGFIGSHLVTALVQDEYDVHVVDNLETGSLENLAHVIDSCSFHEGSVADGALCRNVMEGAEYVWHLAALGSVPRSMKDPLSSNLANVTGTLTVLWAAQQAGIKRVVFASSSSVYGPRATLPQETTAIPDPASPYAVTKLSGERYLKVFHDCYGLETVALRYFNVFGPRQTPNSAYAAVIPAFFKALLSGIPARIEGDGKHSRDFTYVADTVQATIKAMFAERAPGRVYNVAYGNQTSINEVYKMICTILGIQASPDYVAPRPGDVPHSRAGIAVTKNELGFEPQYSLETGLREAAPWYQESLVRD